MFKHNMIIALMFLGSLIEKYKVVFIYMVIMSSLIVFFTSKGFTVFVSFLLICGHGWVSSNAGHNKVNVGTRVCPMKVQLLL